MLQLGATDGQQCWYSDKRVSNTLTRQTASDENVTAGELHCLVAQGTFSEILMTHHYNLSQIHIRPT